MKRLLLPGLSLLLCAYLLSPADKRDVSQKSFPQEYRLTSVRLPLFSRTYPIEMELKNGFLIFCLGNSLHIYSATDYSFVQKVQKTESSSSFQIMRSSSTYLYVMDVNHKNKIFKYRFDPLGHPTVFQSGFTGVANSMNRPFIVRDSLILYDEFIPEASLKVHNLYTNKQVRALPYGTTSLNDRFFDKNMGGLYANDTHIAFVYKYQDRIDFFDWQFNLKRSVNHQLSPPVIDRQNRLANICYYGHSYMGQNYFYTLYRGVSNKVFRTDSLSLRLPNGITIYTYGLTRDVLEVYDMDGLPVARFYFNDIAPEVFVIDEEQNKLLGYRAAYRDSLLLYQLKGLPKNGKKYPEQRLSSSSLPATKEPEDQQSTVQFRGFSSDRDISPTYLVPVAGAEGNFIIVNEATGAFQIKAK